MAIILPARGGLKRPVHSRGESPYAGLRQRLICMHPLNPPVRSGQAVQGAGIGDQASEMATPAWHTHQSPIINNQSKGNQQLPFSRDRGPGVRNGQDRRRRADCGLPSGADQLQYRMEHAPHPRRCGLPSGADQLQSLPAFPPRSGGCGLPSGADQLQFSLLRPPRP